jgi:penicillin-binding protein 1A
MWSSSRRQRPPFYRRPLVVIPLAALLSAALVAATWLLIQKWQWESRAGAFDYRRLSEMESASVIYDRAGATLGRIFIQNRDKVPLEHISPELLRAVVAAEDTRFYQHSGVDYVGIVRAMVANYKAGRTRQGASTLTQQLARNSFPEELPSNDRGYQRKLLEIFVAREIEERFDKSKILEFYLNRVFFGSGFYGVEAAARGYFGKRAADLNLSEAATLAGMLKSPNNLAPWKNRQACLEQRNFVLKRMLELGNITKEEHDTVVEQDLFIKNRQQIHQESYALSLVARQVIDLFGRDSAVSDGFRIYTTLDADLQKKAEAALSAQLAAVERHEGFEAPSFADYDQQFRARERKLATPGAGDVPALAAPEYLQGAIVALDNATGGILTLVGGRDFQHSEYDRVLQSQRPPGTAFKPIVYAAAFERGLFPGTLVRDEVFENQKVMIGGTTGILGEWGPERADNKYEGPISARAALVKSKNGATVRLGMMTGLERLIPLAKEAGIDSPLRPFPATYLGSSEVTLMELTNAYTLFPNLGERPEKPYLIERIETKEGKVVFQGRAPMKRVLKPTTAYEVHSCLSEVLDRGTAERTYTELGLKRFPLGGKTGTAYNFTDTWFVGYSSAVTCGVWVGFDKPRTIYRGAFSNEVALPLWVEVMKATFANYKAQDIAEPKGLIRCEICSGSGQLATDKCAETAQNGETGETIQRRTTYFEMCTEEQAPKVGCDVHTGGGAAAPAQSFVKVIPSTEWPRASLAVNVAARTPVELTGPTVVGDDPYNSIHAINHLIALKSLSGQMAPVQSSTDIPVPAEGPPEEKEIEVRRAEPVRPLEKASEVQAIDTTIKIDPPPPVQF